MLGLVPAFEAKDLPVGQSDRSVGIITVHVAGKRLRRVRSGESSSLDGVRLRRW